MVCKKVKYFENLSSVGELKCFCNLTYRIQDCLYAKHGRLDRGSFWGVLRATNGAHGDIRGPEEFVTHKRVRVQTITTELINVVDWPAASWRFGANVFQIPEIEMIETGKMTWGF